MTSRLLADFGAMTHVAAYQRQSRNTLIKIQRLRSEAVFDPDALGKILPARELLETFRAVNRATRIGIWDVTHKCEDLSDGVREVRNDFREVDLQVAARFQQLIGGRP